MAAYAPHTPLQDVIVAALRKHPEGMSWKDLYKKTGYPRNSFIPWRLVVMLEKDGKVRRCRKTVKDSNINDYRKLSRTLIQKVS